ncbi:hypothetical protein PENSUB_6744 [Penicillium subrubescens]|uniref:DNA 3'-5' helicase n=1 Tax=Penicillium subrubescens TaxID=1316194 RepID=A0A1Q5TXS8_9EURO|nr:hypothetical protein PENSUB_6744 [Penicillium subrubescens]
MWGVDADIGRQWTPAQVTDVMVRESKMRLHERLSLSAYREITISISRRYFGSVKVFPHNVREDGTEIISHDEENEDEMDDEQWVRHIADLQAAHTTYVAEMAYGRMMTQQQVTTAGPQAGFRTSSVHWHDFLRFDANDIPSTPSLVETINMTEALQRMTGDPTMQFRGVQGAAIDAIQRGDSRVVTGMPTGGGKTPMRSRRDFMRRMGESSPSNQAAIVFVTPEAIFTDAFEWFLNRQRDYLRLDRIVMLNTSEKFRPRLQQLGQMHRFGAQMVFLTAPLPPCDESRLFQRMEVERNVDEKLGIFELFRSAANGVIAATSALGMGVDIPDIRCIIHIGFPRSLLDYAQESGWAGRDHLPSEAMII